MVIVCYLNHSIFWLKRPTAAAALPHSLMAGIPQIGRAAKPLRRLDLWWAGVYAVCLKGNWSCRKLTFVRLTFELGVFDILEPRLIGHDRRLSNWNVSATVNLQY